MLRDEWVGRMDSVTESDPPSLLAVLLQNRDGALADVDLYYDHPGERNLNIIKVVGFNDFNILTSMYLTVKHSHPPSSSQLTQHPAIPQHT